MTESRRGGALPRRLVRLERTADGIALYYPPFRLPQVALPLALFGTLAFALPTLGAAAILPTALSTTMGLVASLLIGAFLVPFAIFGAVLVLQALYMLTNALHVKIDAHGLVAKRLFLALPVSETRLARSSIAAIEPRIPTRHQSVLGKEPVYQLVARDALRTRALVVAESLRGEALMSEVKALLEEALGIAPAAPAA